MYNSILVKFFKILQKTAFSNKFVLQNNSLFWARNYKHMTEYRPKKDKLLSNRILLKQAEYLSKKL